MLFKAFYANSLTSISLNIKSSFFALPILMQKVISVDCFFIKTLNILISEDCENNMRAQFTLGAFLFKIEYVSPTLVPKKTTVCGR